MGNRTTLSGALSSLCVGTCLTYAGLAGLAGHAGLVRIGDDQVGLLVDHVSAAPQVITSPGFRFAWPFLQELYIWQKSPREFRMQGNSFENVDHVPRLIVRGPDGSSFWFERVTVHYAVDSNGLERLLRTVGTQPERAAELVNTFARSLMRYELGRFTAEEIVLMENRRAATDRSEQELRRVLARYGLEVLQLAVSKPRFPADYEKTIERREVADQETESLAQQAERLMAGRQERLEQLSRKGELEKEQAVAKLQGKLELARHVNRRARHESEVAADDRIGEGARARDERLAEAQWRTQQALDEATGLAEQVRILGRRGRPLLRRALADVVARTPIVFAPAPRETGMERNR